MGHSAAFAAAVANDVNELLGCWLENDETPRLIVDDDHGVVWHNEAALRMIAGSTVMGTHGGSLTLADPEQQVRFRNQIHAQGENASHLLVTGTDDEQIWIQFDRLTGGEGRFCALTLRNASAPIYADFRTLFLLTAKEDAVLRQLLGGAVADSIAASNETSLDTVRSHIRSIYSKMNVCSREALLAKASVYRIT